MWLVTTLLLLAAQDPGEAPPPKTSHMTEALDRALEDLGDHLATVAEKNIQFVWVVDGSGSMADDLKHIQEKLGDIFRKAGAQKTLQMSVVAFDEEPRLVSRFAKTPDEARAAIASVGASGKGIENCMRAVKEASALFPQGSAYRMLILVTDERGDDEDDVDIAIAAARHVKAHVFVLGREAPFGWMHDYEADADLHFNVTVNAGPESPGIETLQISPLCCRQESTFPWCRKQLHDPVRLQKHESFYQKIDPLKCDFAEDALVPSGFGCWGQARLARETGGRYYMIHGGVTYKPADLDGYEPELGTRKDWQAGHARDPVRRAVMAVLDEIEKTGNFEIPAGGLTPEISNTLCGKATQAEPRITVWIKMLESARAPVTTDGKKVSKRWIAHRDLLRAQLYAFLFWLEQYRLALIEGPYPKEPGTIGLCAQKEVRGKTDDRRRETLARLDEVIQNHPGTPWAATAKAIKERLGGFKLAIIPYGSQAAKTGSK